MAERSFETPQHFAEFVSDENLLEFRGRSSCLKAAFNSIMSIDALAGQIFEQQKQNGEAKAKDDSDFRNLLAEEDENFRLVRDVAKSFKHTALDRGNPLVKRADQTGIGKRPFGLGLYGVGSFGGDEVMLETNSGETKHLLSIAMLASDFLKTKID